LLPAWQRWQRYRSGAVEASRSGHGADTGAGFMRVNPDRDWLALGMQEVSAWDGWRARRGVHRSLDDAACSPGDRIATVTRAVAAAAPDQTGETATAAWLPVPPWLRDQPNKRVERVTLPSA